MAEPDRDLLLDPATQAIAPVDFADLDDLATRILAFQDHYNTNAEPFDWRYTRNDLNTFLARLTAA